MTREEAGERYNIPAEVLREYERWGRSGETAAADRPYDQTDIERLSRIMTLYDVGFKNKEIEEYMRLALSGDDTFREQAEMLRKKRSETLDEIHAKQEQLDRLDYLYFEINKRSAEK